jgi:hypothetical protein
MPVEADVEPGVTRNEVGGGIEFPVATQHVGTQIELVARALTVRHGRSQNGFSL